MKIIDWFKKNYWLALILAIAAILRFYHLGFQSPWADEVLSMNDTNPKLTFKGFYDSVLFWEDFPHLYFLVLKYFMVIFGYSIEAARALSAVIGILGVYGMYLLGKELFSKRAGLIAAGLACVNMFHLIHSQEARSYGMFFLFTVLAFYRLVILIRRPDYRNAAYFGIFSALIVNAHFVGLAVVFSQYVLLLLFLVLRPTQERMRFFIHCFVAGAVTLLLLIPVYEPLMQLADVSSFWVPKPTPDSFTIMFKEFFGNSEMVVFLLSFIAVYYCVNLFKQKLGRHSAADILSNRSVFSFVILTVWLVVSIAIPMIKSYRDVSIILIRYFIGILPVLLLVPAIGIALIRDKMVRNAVFASVLFFSLVDIFVVKDYYNSVSKTQLRELTDQIREKNKDNALIVCHWSWIFPYFFQDMPMQKFEGKSLEAYVQSMQSGSAPKVAFWYADANWRPYALGPQEQAFMDEHFIQRRKIEFFDAWANYYVPKGGVAASPNTGGAVEKLGLKSFSPANFDDSGNMVLFNAATVKASGMTFTKGNYRLTLKGKSLPEKPIDNQNAHLRIRVGGKQIGQLFLSEKPQGSEHGFDFTLDQDRTVDIEIVYDNDLYKDPLDRNVVIYSVAVQKK